MAHKCLLETGVPEPGSVGASLPPALVERKGETKAAAVAMDCRDDAVAENSQPSVDDDLDICMSGGSDLDNLLHDLSPQEKSCYPYKTFTAALLHWWHAVHPQLPRRKMQLLLQLLRHPDFRQQDVPGSWSEFEKLDAVIAVPEPRKLVSA